MLVEIPIQDNHGTVKIVQDWGFESLRVVEVK
jgi:hypothetical protein